MLYQIEELDALTEPVFITAFEGWVSAGSAGTTAADYLAGDAEVVARFDTDELIDYRANRPTLDIRDGVPHDIEWPEITVRHQVLGGRDLLILTGPEVISETIAPLALTRFQNTPSRNTTAIGGEMYACTDCR